MIKSFLKENKTVVIWIGILLISPVILYMLIFGWFDYVSDWKYNVENFEYYQQDFETVVNFCLEYDENSNYSEAIMFSFSANKESLFCYNNNKRIEIPEEYKLSFRRISEAFPHKDAYLDTITCLNGIVYFETDNSLYSVVYSPNGKPKYLDSVNEGKSKKIVENWYHVIRK